MNIQSEENRHTLRDGNENDIVLEVNMQRRSLAKKRVTVFFVTMFAFTAIVLVGMSISGVIYGTVGILFGSVLALGEEIGWRGLLVPELARFTSFTKTSLISGCIWALWHFPVILFFGYHSKAPVWYGLACASTAMILVSFPYAWLRLVSGSVWITALFHGAHNVLFQEVFHPLTADTGITEYAVGEFGALVILPVAFIVWLVYRNRYRIPNFASEEKDLTGLQSQK